MEVDNRTGALSTPTLRVRRSQTLLAQRLLDPGVHTTPTCIIHERQRSGNQRPQRHRFSGILMSVTLRCAETSRRAPGIPSPALVCHVRCAQGSLKACPEPAEGLTRSVGLRLLSSLAAAHRLSTSEPRCGIIGRGWARPAPPRPRKTASALVRPAMCSAHPGVQQEFHVPITCSSGLRPGPDLL